MFDMRTTLTLEDDVAASLKRLSRESGRSFKQVVNDVLRRGLSTPEPSRVPTRRFRVRPFRSPFRPGVDPEKLNQLLDELEARESANRP